jgi:hypothetical protein
VACHPFKYPPSTLHFKQLFLPLLPHLGILITHWTTLNQALIINAWLRVDIEVFDAFKRERKVQNQNGINGSVEFRFLPRINMIHNLGSKYQNNESRRDGISDSKTTAAQRPRVPSGRHFR